MLSAILRSLGIILVNTNARLFTSSNRPCTYPELLKNAFLLDPPQISPSIPNIPNLDPQHIKLLPLRT